MDYGVDSVLLQEIVNYLTEKPFREVAGMLGKLQDAKQIVEPSEKKDGEVNDFISKES